MKKIKIYGDSILKGVMYNEELKRYKLFGYRYEKLAQNGIEVENNCKMGATIEEGFEIVKSTLDDSDKETLVLLEYGGNDCNFNWKEVSNNPKGEFSPNTPEDKFVEIYLRMIDYIKSKGAEVRVCTLVPLDSERFMNWISQGLSYDNILGWMGDINRIFHWQEHYSALAEKAAKISGCKIFDLRKKIIAKAAEPKEVLGIDGMHPNFKGHSLIGDIFQSSMISMAKNL